MENINWLSMVLATLTPMILGFIYYHPKVAGGVWMKSLGITEADIAKNNMVKTMIISIIMAFFLSCFLINFNNSPSQEGVFDTFKHGAFHGLFVGIIVAVPVLVMNGLFELKSLANLTINAVYWVITLAVMGGILDAMNHWPNTM